MVRIWLRATGGKDRHMRYYSHSFFLPLFPPLPSVSWPISGADPKRLKRRTASTYCQPHTPLSLPRSAATTGHGSCFPEVIIAQHISQARLISARSQIVQGSSPLRQGCSHPLYSTTDRKTIDECTSNVTPVPPGREGGRETLWICGAYLLGLKTTDPYFLKQIRIQPEAPGGQKGNRLTVSAGVTHIYASPCMLPIIFTQN